MRRRNRAITAAGLALGAASLMAAPAVHAQGPKLIVGFRALPAAAESRVGLTFATPLDNSSAIIDVATALDAARSRVGGMLDDAVSATVSLGVFSDSQYAEVQFSGSRRPLINHRLSYLVTLDGVSVPSHGPAGTTNSSWTIVIDAKTGEVLEEFSLS